MPLHRCPRVTTPREALDVVQAALLVEAGVLPMAGGWNDQAATFTGAWRIVVREIQHWREVAREAAMREARARANKR